MRSGPIPTRWLKPILVVLAGAVGVVVANRPVWLAGSHAAETTPAPAPSWSHGSFFPIGVYVQPASSFSTWVERGVNTVVGVPEGHDLEEWTAAANEHDLRMVRSPRPDPRGDVGEGRLLAWLHPDEPELNGEPASRLKASYRELKEIDASKPVLVNFSGGFVLGLQGKCDEDCYSQYIAAADWVSSDIYPVSGWGRPDKLGWVGEAVDRLAQWSPERQIFAFIETSRQGNDGSSSDFRAVTPDELRTQIWSAIIGGARGIWYFPVGFDPFQFDATPPAVLREMVVQNQLIAGLAPVLQGEIDPATSVMRGSAPLQVGWRASGDVTYVFALNMSKRSGSFRVMVPDRTSIATAAVHGEGRSVAITDDTISDGYGPYELHIYVLRD